MSGAGDMEDTHAGRPPDSSPAGLWSHKGLKDNMVLHRQNTPEFYTEIPPFPTEKAIGACPFCPSRQRGSRWPFSPRPTASVLPASISHSDGKTRPRLPLGQQEAGLDEASSQDEARRCL